MIKKRPEQEMGRSKTARKDRNIEVTPTQRIPESKPVIYEYSAALEGVGR